MEPWSGSAYGLRTRLPALKGRCPGPLDEGAERWSGLEESNLPRLLPRQVPGRWAKARELALRAPAGSSGRRTSMEYSSFKRAIGCRKARSFIGTGPPSRVCLAGERSGPGRVALRFRIGDPDRGHPGLSDLREHRSRLSSTGSATGDTDHCPLLDRRRPPVTHVDAPCPRKVRRFSARPQFAQRLLQEKTASAGAARP